jgi:hypothetical protein
MTKEHSPAAPTTKSAMTDFDHQLRILRESKPGAPGVPPVLSDDAISDALLEAGVKLEGGTLVIQSLDQVRALHRALLTTTGHLDEASLLSNVKGISEAEIRDLTGRLRGVYPLGPLVDGQPEFGWRYFDNLPPIMGNAAAIVERVLDGAATAIAAHRHAEKRLSEAASTAITVLNDLAATYAAELCDEQRVTRARERMREHGGTLAYIADAVAGLQENVDALNASGS